MGADTPYFGRLKLSQVSDPGSAATSGEQHSACAPAATGPAEALADNKADMCSQSFFTYNTLVTNVLMIRDFF